jgi:hypothetical protein
MLRILESLITKPNCSLAAGFACSFVTMRNTLKPEHQYGSGSSSMLYFFLSFIMHLPLREKTTKICSFHLVPHFEECSPGVTMNSKFIFWELHGTFFGDYSCKETIHSNQLALSGDWT